jgi:hypothetical protein
MKTILICICLFQARFFRKNGIHFIGSHSKQTAGCQAFSSGPSVIVAVPSQASAEHPGGQLGFLRLIIFERLPTCSIFLV